MTVHFSITLIWLSRETADGFLGSDPGEIYTNSAFQEMQVSILILDLLELKNEFLSKQP